MRMRAFGLENVKYNRSVAHKCTVRKEMLMYLNYYIQQLRMLIYTIPVMLIAITVHEFAHGWVSYKLGDPTPKYEGRLSLNPLRHLDLIGTLCLLFFHMGWAKPVRINTAYYRISGRGSSGFLLQSFCQLSYGFSFSADLRRSYAFRKFGEQRRICRSYVVLLFCCA